MAFVRVAILASLLIAAPADAKPFGIVGGHVSYALGGASGGFRQAVDAGIAAGWFTETGNRDGMLATKKGVILTGAVVSGLGAYPTYIEAGVGSATDSGYVGMSAALDLVARIDPDATAGLGIHLNADLLIVQLGARVMVVGADAELVGMFTVGFGRF
jgi:hypothetical protein